MHFKCFHAIFILSSTVLGRCSSAAVGIVGALYVWTRRREGSAKVRGIETVTTYDPVSAEFIINTPCESAQKYWIGGAANDANTVVFSQLNINGINQGVRAFICKIRDTNGNVCDNIRVSDCGNKVGLNGVDNGRIWFDNVRIPRENLLNSVADVTPEGRYVSAIKDPDQRFAAFLAPSTSGCVTTAVTAIYQSKECREVCGGEGLMSEKRVGHLKGEYDVQSTFEGDNNVLMQQVSKALFAEYAASKKNNKPFKGLGLEHMNGHWPVLPCNLSRSPIWREINLQHGIFCYRERDLLNRFVAELSQLQLKGQSKEHAFKASYQLDGDLGKAFTDRTILQSFIDAETSTKDGPLKKMLGLLRSLFVLVTLEEDHAFLRYGYLSVEKSAAVRKEVAKLCCEVSQYALSLVKSFGIPVAFLSPLAFNWIQSNSLACFDLPVSLLNLPIHLRMADICKVLRDAQPTRPHHALTILSSN